MSSTLSFPSKLGNSRPSSALQGKTRRRHRPDSRESHICCIVVQLWRCLQRKLKSLSRPNLKCATLTNIESLYPLSLLLSVALLQYLSLSTCLLSPPLSVTQSYCPESPRRVSLFPPLSSLTEKLTSAARLQDKSSV